MGCVSSTFLDDDDDDDSGPGFGHHIVSLTSTTYGLLTALDPPPPSTQIPPPLPPPPPSPPPPPHLPSPEVINSWELMARHDSTPIKPHPLPPLRSSKLPYSPLGKEISPSLGSLHFPDNLRRSSSCKILRPSNARCSLDSFEKRCPPGGDHTVVLYTTTLRTIRRTFEDCNAVRAALEGHGVRVREKDVSMDLGFREEFRRLMAGTKDCSVPRLFVRGRYIGGAEAVLRSHEDGWLAALLEGLPRAKVVGGYCDGCGDARFLPCFRCSGSRKVAAAMAADEEVEGGGKKGMVVRCPECNENGLVLCPICI